MEKDMAVNIEIMSITKMKKLNAFEQLRSVGGISPMGTTWMLSQPQAIADIEAGKSNFFVYASRQRLRVVIGVAPSGKKYLKTERDEGDTITLLRLPEHPSSYFYHVM
jgi:hypothetical protein